MKCKPCKRKDVALLFFVFMLMLIFVLTLQNKEDTLTLSRTITENITGYLYTHNFPTSWISEGVIRKIAHILEYFALGSAAMYTLSAGGRKLWFSLPISFLMCFGISNVDQFLRHYLPTREFDVSDLIFDGVGYFSGVLIATIIIVLMRIIISLFNRLNKPQLQLENQL